MHIDIYFASFARTRFRMLIMAEHYSLCLDLCILCVLSLIAGFQWNGPWVLKLVFILLLPCVVCAAWGSTFSDMLTNLASNGLSIKKMQDYLNQGVKYTQTEQHGQGLVKEISTTISNAFLASEKIAKDIKQYHETVYEGLGTEPHFYDCCNPPHHVRFTYSERYKGHVDLDGICYMGVGIKAGKVKHFGPELLDIMIKNYKSSSTSRWQYLGTEDGVLHIYPAANRCHIINNDNYDPRFRPWYVEAATPKPKDVVLVIDSSGSMSQRPSFSDRQLITIAKEAAKTVVDTLNPNDKIGLVVFSSNVINPTANNVPECYNNILATGTPKNKENLKLLIDQIRSNGGTQYAPALKAAFKLLNTDEPSSGTEHRTQAKDSVILFLTDGEPNDEANVMPTIHEENARLGNKVTILTFGIGGATTDDAKRRLKDMAQQVGAVSRTVKEGVFTLVDDPENLRTSMGRFYDFFAHGSEVTSISVPYFDGFDLGVISSICVSVKPNNVLRAVACADVYVPELLGAAEFFKPDEFSYAFIVDDFGRLMTHPLLPKLYTYTAQPLFVDMLEVERDPLVRDILNSMLSGGSGNQSIGGTRIVSRGDSIHDGVIAESHSSVFYWHSIPGTNYSVCIVLGENAQDTRFTTSDHMQSFLYHRLDLNRNIDKCEHFKQLGSIERTSVKFTGYAFIKGSVYLDKFETAAMVDEYVRIMEGKSQDISTFRSGVKETVEITSILDKLWTDPVTRNATKNYVVWKYIGTTNGVFRIYPATPLYKQFDHTMRPWYRKALINKGKIVITPPYIDAAGSGVILTLAKTVTQNSNTRDAPLFGVMGLDFTISRFNHLMTELFPDCGQGDTKCFAMDSSGYIIFHPDFVNLDNPNVDVHITEKEPMIAYDLMKRGSMTKHGCVDMTRILNHYFWIVELSSIIAKSASFDYEIRKIKNSNIFLGKIHHHTSDGGYCSCPAKKTRSDKFVYCEKTKSASSSSCECPCSSDSEFNYCANKLEATGSRDSLPLCAPDAPPITDTKQYGKDQVSGLTSCFDYGCDKLDQESDCQNVVGCSWCNGKISKCVYHSNMQKCTSDLSTITMNYIIVPTVCCSIVLIIIISCIIHKRKRRARKSGESSSPRPQITLTGTATYDNRLNDVILTHGDVESMRGVENPYGQPPPYSPSWK